MKFFPIPLNSYNRLHILLRRLIPIIPRSLTRRHTPNPRNQGTKKQNPRKEQRRVFEKKRKKLRG